MENLLDENVLKEISQETWLKDVATYLHRAVNDIHYRNGFLAAARRVADERYAQYLEYAINQLSPIKSNITGVSNGGSIFTNTVKTIEGG